MIRQAVLTSVVGSSHVLLGALTRIIKQLNEAETALQHEETAHKRNHLSEKMKRCLYTSLSYPHSDLMPRTRRGQSTAS
ncbi:hypothetical protein BC827DRAFT_1140833 [Russula dissimulans]|nr:hypothetical protein BC827DRAFT_1140833 [Russula dissimulans]